MLLTNNYYRITNKVYKFISEQNLSSKANRAVLQLILKYV